MKQKSLMKPYRGRHLTDFIWEELGIKRLSNENDWDFLKRVLHVIYKENRIRAFELLWAMPQELWSELKHNLYNNLYSKWSVNEFELYLYKHVPDDPAKKHSPSMS